MPFGSKTAPVIFARLMKEVVESLPNIYYYFDDVLIATESLEEQMKLFLKFFKWVQQASLTVKPRKRESGFSSVTCLGHRIGQSTISSMTTLINKIHEANRPVTKKKVRSFQGLTSHYRDFILHYAALSHPLTDIFKKKLSNKAKWKPGHEVAFTKLKTCLSTTPIFKAVDLSKTFILRTDASERVPRFSLGRSGISHTSLRAAFHCIE